MVNFTQDQIQDRLLENKIPYGVLTLESGVSLLLCQHGGRILGPFLSPKSASLYWMNKVWLDSSAFRDFVLENDWNLGGERVWIAPEIQFNIHDRKDFWGSYHLPEQMDPGQYELNKVNETTWHLHQEITLTAYNLASGKKYLTTDRLISPTLNPLRMLSCCEDLMDGVLYSGYQQTISLVDNNPNEIMSSTWSLIQLIPGGEILIPASPALETVIYGSTPDEQHQWVENGCIRVPVSGLSQFKLGYMSAHIFGRAAYLQPLGKDLFVLIIRNFHNDPSGLYLEEPADRPGKSGQSMFIYNDDGKMGGFGELECMGQAIGGQTGKYMQTDLMQVWIYQGKKHSMLKIAAHLLGFS